MVVCICNVESSVRCQRDAGWLKELGLGRGPAVAGKIAIVIISTTTPSECADGAINPDSSDAIVRQICDVEAAIWCNGNVRGPIELGLSGRPAIAAEAC